jgi:hypothetical protein
MLNIVTGAATFDYSSATQCVHSGTYCREGSSYVDLCEARYFCSNASSRELCPEGHFCLEGTAVPLRCVRPDASDGVLYAVCISYRAVSSVCTGAAVSAPFGLDLSRPPGCAPVEAAPLPYRRHALCANLAVRVQPVPSKCSPGSKVPILGNMLIIFGVGAVCGFEPQRDAAFSMIAMCPFRHDAAVRSGITAWATCATHYVPLRCGDHDACRLGTTFASA